MIQNILVTSKPENRSNCNMIRQLRSIGIVEEKRDVSSLLCKYEISCLCFTCQALQTPYSKTWMYSQSHLSIKRMLSLILTAVFLFPASASANFSCSDISNATTESLVNCLLDESRYSPAIPPPNPPHILHVFILSIRVNFIDEKRQSVNAPVFPVLIYNDSRLAWDQNSTGIPYILVSSNKLYHPTLFFVRRTLEFPSYDGQFSEKVSAIIYPDGTVRSTVWLQDSVSCKLDNYLYPWDIQECDLNMVSFEYKVQGITLSRMCSMTQQTYDAQVLSKCVSTFTNEFEKSLDHFLASPAGWVVHFRDPVNKSDRAMTIDDFQLLEGDGTANLAIFFERKVFGHSVVWIFTPFSLTTLCIYCIFFAW